MNNLPTALLEKGFKLSDGSGNYAFYASEIIEMSNFLKLNKISVLGGDVMIIGKDNCVEYSPTGENWYIDYTKDNSYESYLQNSINNMLEYVKYLSIKHPQFLYVPIFTDENSFNKLKNILPQNKKDFK